ncbi:Biotin carboxyl carrier protein of acetyl-CoA carboxylase [Gluconacetobacter sp. SXCC-1]|uniref:Biotin carboxyl carrier protein of acetyl-CoA carboxylase n=1 Tax=Komagataeibacter rhaeticus TaxID=215221 RepID=A0A181C9K5_9PROT|nr:biotin/lipoyl-containing protein [Komagataeibacter rhaeticus]ATU73192.1 acetyl-CoA carboxylase biotin carboxyl carrier protein subunit [Komagataeibacter xylinus]EGG76888.1 Biotin carboxyl carrier protein of acetyl-CoA carboxylase [Gluconacetobacter sp. SXCC-1]QIP35062.1 biotin/lipoyl-binding protein [Komagataeibacter rhaeticus]QOC47615.1 biotin/lipoyl-binding protein [Komagataeibacter rhaeticus]WPP23036.1 biotin/lipoyl-containing protein [Komagataeibacter rhaeticus]
MDIPQLKRLIDLLAHTPVAELEAEEDGRKIRITRGAAPQPHVAVSRAPASVGGKGAALSAAAVPAQATPAEGRVIKSPSYGIFHLSSSPGTPPYVTVGDEVKEGQQVGLVEAMKVFNAVKATLAGRITAILVEDGAEVEAGTPLFRLA